MVADIFRKTILPVLIIVLTLTVLPVSSAYAEMKIHFIDVGQGDSILVQCDGEAMLVDAGPEEAGAVVNRYLKENLFRNLTER